MFLKKSARLKRCRKYSTAYWNYFASLSLILNYVIKLMTIIIIKVKKKTLNN